MKNFRIVHIDMYWNDNKKKTIINAQCAVGKYDEKDKECVDWDDEIFYWFENHAELSKRYHRPNKLDEFTVKGYRYDDLFECLDCGIDFCMTHKEGTFDEDGLAMCGDCVHACKH